MLYRCATTTVRDIFKHFFAQTVHIKLALPQAALLGIHYYIGVEKSEVLHLLKGPN